MGPALLAGEAGRVDGADVVAVMTPNDSHHELALAALDGGFDLIIDKPLANTLDEADEIARRVAETGLVCCLTHNYTGYPLVRQAQAMVAAGEIGELWLVQVEYVQGGKAVAGRARRRRSRAVALRPGARRAVARAWATSAPTPTTWSGS